LPARSFGATSVDAAPQLVDDGRRVVLLPGGRHAGAFVEDESSCPFARLCFFGRGIGVMNRASRRVSMRRPVG